MTFSWLAVLLIYWLVTGSSPEVLFWLLLIPSFMQDIFDRHGLRDKSKTEG